MKGSVTDTAGRYTFDNVLYGEYITGISAVGYRRTYSKAFTVVPGDKELQISIINVTRDPRELAQVSVVGKRPFIEQRIDRTIVNVANSIIASGSTALEVLEKAPGITIDRQNDQISVRGKEGVIVQIDGKQTLMPMADVVALLKNMPANNIDRIELISNPSARYDAAGNAGIIDIRLKRNNNIGTNGSVNVGGGMGRYARGRAGIQINHRTAKMNLFGNYSASNDRYYWDFHIARKQIEAADQNIINSLSYIRFKNRGQNFKAGVDYNVNRRTTMGIVWTGFWNKLGESSPAHALFQKEETSPVYLHTVSDKTISTNSSNHLVNFNMQHRFTKNEARLSADFDVAGFRRDYRNELNTRTSIPATVSEPTSGLLTEMPTTIDIITFKTDYYQSLSHIWKMEAGVKTSSVLSDNDVELRTGVSGNLIKDTSLSNHFKYKEQVNAAYLSFSGKLNDKLNVMFGLRAEHTHSVASSLALNNVVKRNYLNVFPSAFVRHTLNKQNTLALSYSYRIDRPNYQSLNPARSYLDPYTYSSGNAFLKPQYTHSIELRHGFKEKIFTSFAASYVTDLHFFVLQPMDGKTSRRMPENIGESKAYSLTLSFPVPVTRDWNIQAVLIGVYGSFDYTFKGSPVHVRQINGRINVSNAVAFGKGWTGELTGWLRTPGVNALQETPWLGTIDAGLQKALSNKWKVKLSLQDMLRTNKTLYTIYAPGFSAKGNISMDTRILMFNLTYSFGNQALKSTRQHKTAAEEEIQRTN